jgi:outer membrane receptor protein involved in Fe transport
MEGGDAMKRPLLLAILAVAAAVFILPSSALEAQVFGSIRGVVTDDQGEPLPGVTVTATNDETGRSRTVVTNADGIYIAGQLEPGIYTLVAEMDGMQPTRGEFLEVFTAQVVEINLQMAAGIEEVITVTSQSPLVEVRRAGAATYISDDEVEALPISDRDFKEYALLAPTVQNDPVRGFVTMSGQRGINTGLNVDGTDYKSAFFGYGVGGEATENDGLVVAQDSVREFQVVNSATNAEYGASQGGFINVVTKAGTNDLKGTAFYFFRDDSMAADIPASPLDKSRGNSEDTPVDAFDRETFGGSVGGPIIRDRTHWFFSFDQVNRDVPFKRNLNVKGGYDAVLAMESQIPGISTLVDGFEPNNDGVAAPDPVNGRTASGNFTRSVDNLILFGKINHQFTANHSGSLRVNWTDYERISSFKDEESEKIEETTSWVGELVSIFGANKINEFRFQFADDQLDRLSLRVGEPVEAQIRFRGRDGAGSGEVGKFDFLPILVEEEKFQIQDNFSYIFGDHDLKFGINYQKDDLAQLFAGSKDGRYDFNTLEDFLNNDASVVRIYYGDVTYPNYDEAQVLTAIYAQDTWRVNDRLTVSYGIRYGETDNPDGLTHIFPEGVNIPDDDHFAPRFGFTYSPGDSGFNVIRGGFGYFYGRTPSLIFASQVQENGIFPNFGRVIVGSGDPAFVPLGQSINNENPPDGTIPSTSYVVPGYKDPETMRINLGYERQFGDTWAAGIDGIYAEGSNLQSNIDINRTMTYDEFGRPVYSPVRPDPNFNQIFIRDDIGESEYTAVTLSVRRRYTGRYQLQAHYTWSEDKDTDSNERSATSVTVSDMTNARYDWGFAERDITDRFLISGLVDLGWGFRLSGLAEYRSGRPWDPTDADADFVNCGFASLGFNCTNTRPVVNGKIVERNSGRNMSVERIDMRLSWLYEFGDRYQIELFGEVFNMLDENSWEIPFGFGGDNQRDPTNEEYGLEDSLITTPRQYQLGARFRF